MTVYSQSGTPDSTRLISIPAWRVYRLIHDVKKLHYCEKVVVLQENKIELLESLVNNKDKKIELLELQVNTEREFSWKKDEIINSQNKFIKQKNKEVFIFKLISVGQLILIILLVA